VKLTKSQLKQIIKEALEETLKTGIEGEEEYGVAEPPMSHLTHEPPDEELSRWSWNDIEDTLVAKLGHEPGKLLASLVHRGVAAHSDEGMKKDMYLQVATALGIEGSDPHKDIQTSYRENKS
tara:strand:- start:18 stop:383 length:366 start_codon:yes stop_codon:yes gene_type:complete